SKVENLRLSVSAPKLLTPRRPRSATCSKGALCGQISSGGDKPLSAGLPTGGARPEAPRIVPLPVTSGAALSARQNSDEGWRSLEKVDLVRASRRRSQHLLSASVIASP